MKLWEIDEQIKMVCPISGISSSGDIRFLPSATEAQKAAAQAIMVEKLALVELD